MQSATAREHYLSTDVNTATPQRLQLLLIETALRLAKRAQQFWQQGRDDLAIGPLVHAQSMVAEMLSSMNREAGGDLTNRSSALYEFVYRSLVKAGHRRDEASLDAATRVLEIERETWRLLCEKLATEHIPPSPGIAIETAQHHLRLDSGMIEAGGFSIEA